jgi:predicted glycosyltransferase
MRTGLLIFGKQQFDDFGGARQAAGMGGENTVCHVRHAISAALIPAQVRTHAKSR